MRFDPYGKGARYYQDVLALAGDLRRGPLDEGLSQLVQIRVSQINGCAFCMKLHSGMARRAGVGQDKLDTLAGGWDAAPFSESERAALGLAEEMTRLGDGSRVDDPTWAAVRAAFDDDELAALLYLVGLINVWNRINVAVQLPDDQPRPQTATAS